MYYSVPWESYREYLTLRWRDRWRYVLACVQFHSLARRESVERIAEGFRDEWYSLAIFERASPPFSTSVISGFLPTRRLSKWILIPIPTRARVCIQYISSVIYSLASPSACSGTMFASAVRNNGRPLLTDYSVLCVWSQQAISAACPILHVDDHLGWREGATSSNQEQRGAEAIHRPVSVEAFIYISIWCI